MNHFLTLEEHCEKIGSGSTPTGGSVSYIPNGIPLIRSQNVLMRSFTREGLVHITPQTHSEMSGTEVHSGDVLLNITGASIGRVCVVPDDVCPANVNQHVCIVRPKGTIDPEFLTLFLSSPSFQRIINDTQAGGTRQALTKTDIERFQIPALGITRQREIAKKLESQLREIENAQAAILAQLHETAVLARRIRGDAQTHLRDADRVPLGDLLLRIDAGRSFQTADRLAGDNELGVLKVSAVSWAEFKPNEAKAINGDYSPDERHRVRAGDVIISRANTVELVGAVVRADRDYPNRLLSDKTLRLVLDERQCDPDYIVHLLRFSEARAHLEGNATGTSNSMRNITQETLRATPIPLPNIKEQYRIASRLQGVDRAIRSLRDATQIQLREIRFLPGRLLTQVFDS